MSFKETYFQSPLSQQILRRVQSIHFGDDYHVIPVTNAALVESVLNSPLENFDYRTPLDSKPSIASVFEGLDFDANRVRSQVLILCSVESNTPIGLMSTVIAPASWIAGLKYIKQALEGVRICSFAEVNNAQPDFLVIPGWTKIDPAYSVRFAIPGFLAFKAIMNTIQETAPHSTWIEIAAKGQWPDEQQTELQKIVSYDFGTFIPKSCLPANLFELIGKNARESSSSVKMAILLGISRISGIGSTTSLGPVFAKQVK